MMDSDQLLNQIQTLLEGVEKRVNIRFDNAAYETEQTKADLSRDIQRLTARVDVCTGLMEKLVPSFLDYMRDAGKSEAEFRLRLSALESRVNRMEGPRQ